MERLNLWNGRLNGLIQGAKGRPADIPDPPQAPKPQNIRNRNTLLDNIRSPTSPFYALVRNLYKTLSDSWSCTCNSGHEAKFCLKINNAPAKGLSADPVLDFDFLMSIAEKNGSCCWQEGTISIGLGRYVSED
jgi:hypothetical protein